MIENKNPRLIGAGILITLIICITILASNAWLSSRPVYVQYNTGTDGKPVNNVSVTATGKVFVKPDIATFYAGYESKNQSLTALQKDLSDKSNAIINALKAEGVLDKDIQTSEFNLNPVYRYESSSNKQIFDGYSGSVKVSVKIRDLTKTGAVIDKSVGAGANTIENVYFTLENMENAKTDARKLAAGVAKSKAQTLVEASGAGLGGLIAISESSDYSPYVYNYSANAVKNSIDSSASTPTTTINPGSMEVSITISATYAIK